MSVKANRTYYCTRSVQAQEKYIYIKKISQKMNGMMKKNVMISPVRCSKGFSGTAGLVVFSTDPCDTKQTNQQ